MKQKHLLLLLLLKIALYRRSSCKNFQKTAQCAKKQKPVNDIMVREVASIMKQLQKQLWNSMKGNMDMKKKIKALLLVAILTLACATTSLACTPKLATPKISIPTITNVKLSEGVQKSVRDYVKNLNFKFNFN